MLYVLSFSQTSRPLELPAKLPILFNILQSFLCLIHSAGLRPLIDFSAVNLSTRKRRQKDKEALLVQYKHEFVLKDIILRVNERERLKPTKAKILHQ
jgi:hypothetical protein